MMDICLYGVDKNLEDQEYKGSLIANSKLVWIRGYETPERMTFKVIPFQPIALDRRLVCDRDI